MAVVISARDARIIKQLAAECSYNYGTVEQLSRDLMGVVGSQLGAVPAARLILGT